MTQVRPYHQLAARLRHYMREQGFCPGDRLPPERDLAARFGVSRPSLREGLIALEISGVLEIRQGSGIYLRNLGDLDGPVEPSWLGESPQDIMQARAFLEGEIVSLACARIDSTGLKQLSALVAAMGEQPCAAPSTLELDQRFHALIAQLAGNPVLVRLLDELLRERFSPLPNAYINAVETNANWAEAVIEHRQIVFALEQRDPSAAQAAIRHHLQESCSRWLASLEGAPLVRVL